MTPEQGIQRLIFHTLPETGSFLDMLRPYNGLKQDVLVDVLDALRASAPKIKEGMLQRELACALWAISYLGRRWSLAPGGMLRRNHLISEIDQAALESFFERFDYAVMILLEDGNFDEAFHGLGLGGTSS